jgi:glycosyltransferase involved in cell wall biosynthesis
MSAPPTSATHKRCPAFPEIGVIALPPDEWGQKWQVRHQILSRLANYFYVVWMNPALDWHKTLSKRDEDNCNQGPNSSPPGLLLYRARLLLPHFYRPQWLADWTFRKRLHHSRNLLLRRGCRKILLYLWRPEFVRALDLIPSDLSLYHIDDEYSFSSSDLPVSPVEREVLGRVNQVFIHSPALLEKKGKFNPHTEFVPNGVDFASFSVPVPPPSDIANIAHPRIGYAGYIKKQLDLPLLLQLGKAHPNWQFVFVGALSPHPEIAESIAMLRVLPNVHFLGAKSTRELTAYPQHFDVCIMPYVLDGYTRYIYPVKLHEYLASGRPVVGTRIVSLAPFAGVVDLAENSSQWEECIARQLLPDANSRARRETRQSIARQHDWEVLAERIARTMIRGSAPELCERLSSPATEVGTGPVHP